MRTMITSPVAVRLEIRGLIKALADRLGRKNPFQDKTATVVMTATREIAARTREARDFLGGSETGATGDMELPERSLTALSTAEAAGPTTAEVATIFCEPEWFGRRWVRPEPVSRLRCLRSVCR